MQIAIATASKAVTFLASVSLCLQPIAKSSVQCFEAVRWSTEIISGLKKTSCRKPYGLLNGRLGRAGVTVPVLVKLKTAV